MEFVESTVFRVKVEINFTLQHTMKAKRRSRIYLYSLYDNGPRWGCVVNVTSLPLFPPGMALYTLYRRLCG